MYYLSLVAPAAINGPVLKWKLKMQKEYRCQVALKSPAHLTLIPPFWMKEEREKNLEHETDQFAASQHSFTVMLQNFNFFEQRVIFIDVAKNEILNNLQQGLSQHLMNTRFPISKGSLTFHPHITIATRDLYKKSFSDAWAYFSKKEFKTSWVVDGISIMKLHKIKWEVLHTSHYLI